jgi:hypothetical protein
MLTPDSHGTGAPVICRISPDSQTKAVQKLSPRNSVKERVSGEATMPLASARLPCHSRHIQFGTIDNFHVFFSISCKVVIFLGKQARVAFLDGRLVTPGSPYRKKL